LPLTISGRLTSPVQDHVLRPADREDAAEIAPHEGVGVDDEAVGEAKDPVSSLDLHGLSKLV
jgi:hypothetical protein